MEIVTRDGRPVAPDYLLGIDIEKCIGCGRCFKVCGRDVMALKGINEEGVLIDLDNDDDEICRKVMTLANPGSCIGCGACERVCPKDCQEHGPG